MTDDFWVLVAVTLAAGFGFLSFLNTLGMHLAVREIKKRVVRILTRVEKAMDDPVGYIAPVVQGFVVKLNDDKEFRLHIGGAIAFAARTALTAASGPPEVGADGKPKPATRGWLKTITDLAGVAQQFGLLKIPKP